MAENEDYRPLRSKRKAITALLPYAIWQERDGQPEMFNAVLCATRASGMSMFMWGYITQSFNTLLGASPRAIILALPHVPWWSKGAESLVQQWVATVSAIPYTEEVAQSVVDMLLQILPNSNLLRYITTDIWTWLTKQPSLPPVCSGRYTVTSASAIKAVRALRDIEVLKSYLLLVWSEWNSVLSEDPKHSLSWSVIHGISFSCPLSGSAPDYCLTDSSPEISCNFCMMQISIQEDFGGDWRKIHREELVRHLDHVLAQLSRGLEYFKRHDPDTNADDLTRRWDQYGILRRTLLETGVLAGCMSHFNTNYAPLCANSYPGCSQDRAPRVCVHTFSRARCLAPGTLDTPTPCFVRVSASVQHVVTFQGFLRLHILSTIHMFDSVSISPSFIYTFHLRLHMLHGSCFLLSSSSSIR